LGSDNALVFAGPRMSGIKSVEKLRACIVAKLEARPIGASDATCYRELLTLIGEYELASMEENVICDVNFYIFYMGLYIIVDDINGAKHLWRRSPPHVQSNTAYTQLKNVCLQLMKNDTNAVNQILMSSSWSEFKFMNCNIVDTVILFLREKLWKTVHKAYKIIKLNHLAQFVMLEVDETKLECSKLGWNIDENNLVTPTASNDVYSINVAEDQVVLVKTLSTYISQIERKQLKIDITKTKEKKADTRDEMDIAKGDHHPRI